MIQVICLVARNDNSIPKTNALANEVINKVNNKTMILVLQNSFGDQRWESWVDKEAHRQYCQETNDYKNESYHKGKAQEVFDEWVDLLKNGKINAYYSDKLESLNGKIGFDNYFKQIVGYLFRYGTEQLSTVNTLYRQAGNAACEYGLGVRPFVNPYTNLTNQFEAKGFWNETWGYNKFPDHPLSKLKEFINTYFQNNDRVYLDALWKELQKPPFGLMKTNIGAFIFSMSLRDFSTGFYVSDGLSSQELNPDKLAGILPEIIKENIAYSNYSIQKLSQEDRDLCDILPCLFKLDSERCKYPLGAKQELALRLDSIGYPIWGLQYHDLFVSDEKICESLKILGQFLCSEADDQFEANRIKKINEGLEKVLGDGTLEQIFTSKVEYQSGFVKFLKMTEPELDEAIQQLGVEHLKIMALFKNKLKKAVYLWVDQDIKDIAPETINELTLIKSMNDFCGSKSTDINELRQKLKKTWLSNRLPLTLWVETEENDNIQDTLRHLDFFLRDEDLDLEANEILAKGLKKYKDYLQKRLLDTKNTLRKFIIKNFHRELDEGDIAQLISEIPDMTEVSNLAQIKQTIEDSLNKLKIILLRKELKDKWREFTDSSSPSDWSIKNNVPIRWIIKIGDEDFFNILNNIDKASESELKTILETIKSNKSELKALANEQYINDVFLRHACDDYHDIVKDANVNDLKIYLKNNVSSKPDEWPQELVKFKDAIESWVLNLYTQIILGEVIKKIDGAGDSEIKKFMKKLAEKNPKVGIEVMKNI